MAYNIEKIFEDCGYLSSVRSKKEYEGNTSKFKNDRLEYLRGLIDSDSPRAAAEEFCSDVFDAFQKRGRIRGRDQMNLNYFMIYYIFPTILSEKENGNEICDTLKEQWNIKFKENISYTDYDSLMEGFQTKIFGIPIGKK